MSQTAKCLFVSLFFVLSRSRFVLVSDAPTAPLGYLRPCSRQVYKEAAFGGSAVDGQPARARQSGAGIHLPASGRERYRLEGHSRRHHARKLHQQHRLQLLHRGHNVSTAAKLVPVPPPSFKFLSFPMAVSTECSPSLFR